MGVELRFERPQGYGMETRKGHILGYKMDEVVDQSVLSAFCDSVYKEPWCNSWLGLGLRSRVLASSYSALLACQDKESTRLDQTTFPDSSTAFYSCS